MTTLIQVVERGLTKLDFSQPQCIAVALSGGRDSVALLHLLAKLFAKESVASSAKHKDPAWTLCALHVNHGLQADSRYWAQCCNELCFELGIQLYTHTYAPNELLETQKGKGLEAAARQARYRALLGLAQQAQATVLALAHHQDDQAETVLLQIARGTGLAGAAAMPELSQRAQLLWWRPLLSTTRAQINLYVARQKLRYIDDPSNAFAQHNEHELRRNALRHHVMPALENAYPGASLNLARFAARAAQANQELMAIAQQDWQLHQDAQQSWPQSAKQSVDLDLNLAPPPVGPLRDSFCKALSPERRANLLRYWLQLQGVPAPEQSQLNEIFQQWFHARSDAQPTIVLGRVQLRRFAGGLYVARAASQQVLLHAQNRLATRVATPAPQVRWLPALEGQLGLKEPEVPEGSVWVQRKALHDFGVVSSGLTFRLAANRPARTLKQQFQSAQIPVWLREDAWVLIADRAIVWVEYLGFNAGHSQVLGHDERFTFQINAN
jgi:tRNA(Ile)-lysidine synthase